MMHQLVLEDIRDIANLGNRTIKGCDNFTDGRFLAVRQRDPDLIDVAGIGDARLEVLRPLVTV